MDVDRRDTIDDSLPNPGRAWAGSGQTGERQSSVIRKLCGALVHGGVILFTAAGIDAEILGEMYDEQFYYSSLAAMDYLRLLAEMECRCVLLDRDKYPAENE